MDLGNTIVDENDALNQDRAKVIIFFRRHLDERLKVEYLTVKDPLVLWQDLKERFDHRKITSQLSLCGEKITDEEMLEKTFSAFHVSNMLLQQQYRKKGFKKYSELIACFLLAKQNNELLLKNHESRPTVASPFPEANGTQFQNSGQGRGRGRRGSRGRSRGRSRGHERDRSRFVPRKNYSRSKQQNISQKRENNYDPKNGEKKVYEEKCYRCGMKSHWSRTYHTAEHLVDLYQVSLKKKDKDIETNFIDQKNDYDDADDTDMTHLDVADFFEHPEDVNKYPIIV
ncbi:uncharacterized protein [Coffea arabica]|uniref:Uncharacterized protein n=1 Tax=Coffea arabica TaxID=13443 RepID=A0A6P6W248_COFAR|nr:uncharacterized protein LOC113728260 [Coffea arabica]